jgi:hypothetical protein
MLTGGEFEKNVQEVKELPREDQVQVQKATVGIMGYLKQQMPSMADVMAAGVGLGFALYQFKKGMYGWEEIVDAYMSQSANDPNFVMLNPQGGVTTGGGGVRKKGHARIIGYGIAADPDVRYSQFGCYLLHKPSLEKNIINIKFPSLASHPKIPQRVASEELVTFIKKVLEEGQMNAPLYAALSESDKEYFDNLAHMCKVGGKLGISVKKDNEDMKRFEIVRGEILAGNDAPQLIKELKHLTLKLIADGKIPKRSAHDLLYEIAIL